MQTCRGVGLTLQVSIVMALQAWFREGEAAKALNLWEDAALAYYEAFQLNPKEDRLAREFQAAIEEGRKQHKAKEAQ